jgi:hypothetical protein
MVYDPDCSDEQGGCFGTEYKEESSIEYEKPEELKRFPSHESFDQQKALLDSFGLTKMDKAPFGCQLPESEQLGVVQDIEMQNDLERLSLDSDEILKGSRQEPDENSQQRTKKEPLSVEQISLNARQGSLLIKIPPNEGDFDHQPMALDAGSNSEEDEKSAIMGQNEDEKEIRWRKEDDKMLFATYRTMCRNSMLNLKDVAQEPLRKNKMHKKLFQEVAKKAQWKGKLSMMVRRIKKILNDGELSVRGKQDLIRMYKRQVKAGLLNWEKILFEFPGKNLCARTKCTRSCSKR